MTRVIYIKLVSLDFSRRKKKASAQLQRSIPSSCFVRFRRRETSRRASRRSVWWWVHLGKRAGENGRLIIIITIIACPSKTTDVYISDSFQTLFIAYLYTYVFIVTGTAEKNKRPENSCIGTSNGFYVYYYFNETTRCFRHLTSKIGVFFFFLHTTTPI